MNNNNLITDRSFNDPYETYLNDPYEVYPSKPEKTKRIKKVNEKVKKTSSKVFSSNSNNNSSTSLARASTSSKTFNKKNGEIKKSFSQNKKIQTFPQTNQTDPYDNENTFDSSTKKNIDKTANPLTAKGFEAGKSSKPRFTPITFQSYPITFQSYPIDNSNFEQITIDPRLKNQLSEEAAIFLQEEGKAYASEAKATGKPLIVKFKDKNQQLKQLIIFKPSDKIYLSINTLGAGKFKTTLKIILLHDNALTQLSSNLKYRAISLTKENEDIKLNKQDLEAQEHEKKLHEYLKSMSKNHTLSNVCIAKSVFTTSYNQTGIMTEVCHGNINDLIDGNMYMLSDADRYFIAAQMALGVSQLHDIGIVHRDLKPDNFLYKMDEKGKVVQVKISDFGVSSHIQESLQYKAPKFPFIYIDPQWHIATENYEKAPQFLKESDVYQLGVTLYQFFTGQTQEKLTIYFQESALKFRTNNNNDNHAILRQFKQSPNSWRKLEKIEDTTVKDFILSMLSPEIQNRPTMKDVANFFMNKSIEAEAAE